MVRHVGKLTSPRHGFTFSGIPTIKGSMYGGGDIAKLCWQDYGPVLDCVFEMTRDVAEGNGETYEQAMVQVLKDEGWRLLPTHKRQILDRLKGQA